MTVEELSMTDADRILGIADQFLEDWAEDAVQNGNRDCEYEERAEEWKAVRPLLVAAPTLLRALHTIVAGNSGPTPFTLEECTALARTAIFTISGRTQGCHGDSE
jgi:hypothetical protein